AADAGHIGMNGVIPDVQSLRIPMRYLANLLTAGDEAPVVAALNRMLTMRAYKRAETVHGVADELLLRKAGLTAEQV
ncbi:nitrate reductase subunit beta, partial [Cobetia sp. SIMBA_158]